MNRLQQLLAQIFKGQGDRFFLWSPVSLGIGSGLYFNAPSEPNLYVLLAATSLFIILTWGSRKSYFAQLACMACLFISLGSTLACLKTTAYQHPKITKKIKNISLSGQLKQIEYRPGSTRFTIHQPTFKNWPQEQEQPLRIRLVSKAHHPDLKPGMTIQFTATLMPLQNQLLPGGYDMAFHLYFDQIGATGFISGPIQITHDPRATGNNLQHMRSHINQRLKKLMPVPYSGLASALITGEKSGIPKDTRQLFADTGIAHILAISGLHMSIIAGFIFFLIRRGLCLIPSIAERHPTKKWAAASAIVLSGFYLLLSGMPVSALRAFMMTSLMMVAMIVDRQALTLRNVAIAAFIILVIWPESIMSPGFQLSFASVTGLVALFEFYRKSHLFMKMMHVPALFKYPVGIIVTTIIATAVTAPLVGYTFNRLPTYTLIANMLAIPITAFWIMPCALMLVITMPFGLDSIFASAMHLGLQWLSYGTTQVMQLPLPVIPVPHVDKSYVIMAVLGSLWVMFWTRWWRVLGFLGPALYVYVLFSSQTPDIYASQRYGLVGLKDQGILWLTETSRGKYLSSNWQGFAGVLHQKHLQDHPKFQCSRFVCWGKWHSQKLVISRHWQHHLRYCADHMISFKKSALACPGQQIIIHKNSTKTALLTRQNNGYLSYIWKNISIQRPWTI